MNVKKTNEELSFLYENCKGLLVNAVLNIIEKSIFNYI